MGRGTVTPNPDPQKIGTVPLDGAVDAGFLACLRFNGPLDDGHNPSGFTARITCYDSAGDLMSGPMSGDGSPVISPTLPQQMTIQFDEPADPPELSSPGIVFDNSAGHVWLADGSPAPSGTVGIIDISVV